MSRAGRRSDQEALRCSSARMEEEKNWSWLEEAAAARKQSSTGEAITAVRPSVRVVSSLVQGDMMLEVRIDEEEHQLPEAATATEEATPLDDGHNILDCPQEEEEEEDDYERNPADLHHRRKSVSKLLGVGDDERNPANLRHRRKSVWKLDKYELPMSTFTFLITERPVSKSFCMGILAYCISFTSLVIVLINEINNGTANSPQGLPAGVPTEVRIAQYLGIIIGVLMEEEVPLGLEILWKAVEQKMFDREPFKLWRVVLSSFLRLSIGYLFLACLFFTIVQESDVLNIFFDVLALEFVENIDDVLYALSRRGFFGKALKRASYEMHTYEPPGCNSRTHTIAKWMKRFASLVYFFNGVLMLFGLSYLTAKQHQGDFRCKSITVAFSDDVWEDSWIRLDGHNDNGGYNYEKRLLVYSHFNGIYVEDGTHDGHPKYIERNKEDGDPFLRTIGAEIIYCKELEAWVFRHEKIFTSPADLDKENECRWLLRSPETESFDIIEVAQDRNKWMIWAGQSVQDYSITITCNECYDEAGCNYHGDCVDQKCYCEEEKYFGSHCEYDRPCEVLRSEKDANTTLHLVHDIADDMVHFVEVYGHPKYVAEHMSGIPYNLMKLKPTDDSFSDDDFFQIHTELEPFNELLRNYTFVLRYTGRRWLGQIAENGLHYAAGFEEEEYHAYWDNTFSGLGIDDNATVIISAPTSHASPVGVDFFEMRRRNTEFEDGIHDYDYSPFGVLIPSIGAAGAGYFHCNKDG